MMAGFNRRLARVAVIALGIAFMLSLTTLADDDRLGDVATPTNQIIRLKLDPTQADYTGSVVIDITVNRSSDIIRFHAEEMNLNRVALFSGDTEIKTTFEVGPVATIVLKSEANFEPGEYRLEIDFDNDFNTRANSLYSLETDGNNYCFTQFEADDAREAFPCWDEPEFKFPYQLILTVPEADMAVSNTPIESEEVADGWKTVVFKKIKPTPSYMLAFATGPLETVEVPGTSIPTRIITPKGKTNLVVDATRITPLILSALEEYFGQPYPYEKLDLIAVPEYWAGAMENPGLVTFRETILLVDPEMSTESRKRGLASIISHELAHMWFGDLVTMVWWDDIWLNESFASWLGDKIAHQEFPQYHMDISLAGSKHYAMITDGRSSTKPMRREALAASELGQMFDALSYSKGQAVLGMFEQRIGAEKFRQGVINYIKENSWGNAVAADFFRALTAASGEDLAALMAPYLDQAGVPTVTLEYLGNNRARLSQKRFSNYGSEAPPETLWPIPMKLKYFDGTTVHSKSILLTEQSMEIDLPGEGEVTWVYPDQDVFGYYRWSLPEEMMLSMAAQAQRILQTKERVAFLNNLSALLDAGDIAGDKYLQLVSSFADDPDPEVVSSVISGISKVNGAFVTIDTEDEFAVYISKTLGPALKRFGLEKKDGEPETVTMFRPRLIGWLADEGRDEDVRKYVLSLAAKYNEDPLSIDPSLAGTAVYVSALVGDETLYEDYRQRFESATVPRVRSRYLSALGHFRDPKLIQTALKYVFEGPLRPQELFSIPRGIGGDRRNEDMIFEWTLENYDNFLERIPKSYTTYLPYMAGGCSLQRLEAAQQFFGEPEHNVPGTDENLHKVTVQVNDCVALREREGEVVDAYLRKIASSQ